MTCECNHTGMYELLESIEAAIGSAGQPERDALAKTINSYMNDFPDEYFWAVGPQAPTLLHHIMHAIEPPSKRAALAA
jgi:hypothetical protein